MVIETGRAKAAVLSWLMLTSLLAAPPPSPAQDPALRNSGVLEDWDEEAFLDVDADEGEGEIEVSITRDGLVEMHSQGLDLQLVLQQLLLKTRKNIIFGKNVGGSVHVSLYNVTLDEALKAILKPHGFGYREEGNFIYVYTEEELDRILQSQRVETTRTYRLNYISPTDAALLLQPFLTPEIGEIFTGPVAGAATAQGAGAQNLAIEDLIVLRDYEDNLDRIERQLALIDKRPKQVLVEATIVRATLNETNALGIDFNILGGVDFEILAAADGRTTPLVKGNNVPGGSDFGTLTNSVPLQKLDDLTFGVSTSFARDVPGGGFTFGVVTDEVSLFLRALESVTDVAVIANPKVLTLNKQNAQVLVGSRDGYLTSQITTETATTQNVDFLETGTQLRFTPFISHDGYVRMQVTPSDSTGGVDARGLPFERTTEVTTNILVKDGHTILIGGLFRETDSTGRSQIPLLGSLPVVGQAFRSTSDSTVREEVIILLTVHVVDNEDQYSAMSDQILEDSERLRVGLRESMQVGGRERLAQANYHKALEYANEKNWKMALWHTNLAIHNRPSFMEAIKLREEILQQRNWDDDGTVSRMFMKKLILQDQGLPARLFDRPSLPDLPPEDGP